MDELTIFAQTVVELAKEFPLTLATAGQKP